MIKMVKKSVIKKREGDYFKILAYIARFLALSLPISLIFGMDFFYLRFLFARIALFLLSFIGVAADFLPELPGLFYNERIVSVDSACTGIRSFYLLFAMLFAFRGDYFSKLKCLFFGGLALFFFNAFRIFLSSAVFFIVGSRIDNFLWAFGLNILALFIVYLLAKSKGIKSLI